VYAVTNALVSQYKYDDVIEAMFSSDEAGNFFKSISFQTLATATTPTTGFSVPVDASNLYIEFRVGNKVYVKLKICIQIFIWGMRIGGLFVTTKSRRGPTLAKRLQKNIERLVYPSKRRVGSVFEAIKLLNDSNLNTLVELSEVQFVEEAMGAIILRK
jgi:hypothetical protein